MSGKTFKHLSYPALPCPCSVLFFNIFPISKLLIYLLITDYRIIANASTKTYAYSLHNHILCAKKEGSCFHNNLNNNDNQSTYLWQDFHFLATAGLLAGTGKNGLCICVVHMYITGAATVHVFGHNYFLNKGKVSAHAPIAEIPFLWF